MAVSEVHFNVRGRGAVRERPANNEGRLWGSERAREGGQGEKGEDLEERRHCIVKEREKTNVGTWIVWW
jgi:hypothetical protein